ncbi:MAG: hypothetical protein QXL94_03575 [Candidatus Parvarchaeum sp.]
MGEQIINLPKVENTENKSEINQNKTENNPEIAPKNRKTRKDKGQKHLFKSKKTNKSEKIEINIDKSISTAPKLSEIKNKSNKIFIKSNKSRKKENKPQEIANKSQKSDLSYLIPIILIIGIFAFIYFFIFPQNQAQKGATQIFR